MRSGKNSNLSSTWKKKTAAAVKVNAAAAVAAAAATVANVAGSSTITTIDRTQLRDCGNGTTFLNFVYELLESEENNIETVVTMINYISSSTLWTWCIDDKETLCSRYVLLFCNLLKDVVKRYMYFRRKAYDESSQPNVRRCHLVPLESWFSRVFDIPIWQIMPRTYFINEALPLFCEDILFGEISSNGGLLCDCLHTDETSKNFSKLCLRKIMDGTRFTRQDIDALEETFKFFLKRDDIYMIFPLSFFIPLNKMNRIFRFLLICHTLPKKVVRASDKEKLDVLTYLRFCRNLTIDNPTLMLKRLLSVTYDVTTNLHRDNGSSDDGDEKSWSLQIAEFLFQQFGLCCISDMYDDYPDLYSYVEKYISYYLANIIS